MLLCATASFPESHAPIVILGQKWCHMVKSFHHYADLLLCSIITKVTDIKDHILPWRGICDDYSADLFADGLKPPGTPGFWFLRKAGSSTMPEKLNGLSILLSPIIYAI